MKIDFLLLSVTLFAALSFANEATQEAAIVPCSEAPSFTETEQNEEFTEEEIPQNDSDTALPEEADSTPIEEATAEVVTEEEIPQNNSDTALPEEVESTPIDETSETDAAVSIAQEEVAPRHPGDDYLELALGLYESCKSLGQILEQVHNMPTADAAAPEVAALTDRILSLMRSESMLPPPSVEIQQYVQEHISTLNTAEVSEKAMGRVIDLVTKTDPICYGSSALRTELQRLVRGLLGR